MNASVVINTYNRGPYLSAVIRSIAAQSFAATELVVVNGPSTDNTEEVLQSMRADGYAFKLLRCDSRNLSESRNIGIAASVGDIVMFIDDDAIAHPRWVERLMRPYCDDNVGGVGGFTIDHTGMAFQCRYTICDRLGNARFTSHLDPEQLLTAGVGFAFPSLLGTNCSFRRSDLMRIGGFDEVFAYMLDETDICARIFDLGQRIVTLPNAYVLHKYAPSHTRTSERIPTSLLAPSRSKSYFVLKHGARTQMNMNELFGEISRYRADIEFSNRWFLDHKKVSVAHYDRLMSELQAGIAEGISLGTDVSRHARVSAHLVGSAAPGDFQPLRSDRRYQTNSKSLRIYFVSQGYPPNDTAGIARWTHECALGLVDLGHEVHVITRSPLESAYVDVLDGVWVHFVADCFDDETMMLPPVHVPGSVLRRAEAVVAEIERAKAIWGVDVVSAPIWDLEGLLCVANLAAPVVTSLHTTYRLALPFKPEWTSDAGYRSNHVEPVIAGERWLLENSAAILANSEEIVREIDSAYGTKLRAGRIPMSVVPHGLGAAPALTLATPPAAGAAIKILFVGRLEARKGPDTLAGALLLLPADTPPVEIQFVGHSPGESDSFVRDLKSALGRAQARLPQLTVKFVGYVDDQALERFYAGCDVFVAPSRFESFGLILIEAMRWAKPVIASDVGGMREVLEHGQSGILNPVGDAQQLAASLQQLLSDPAERARLGQAGRLRYQQRFTRSRMAAGLEGFFAAAVAAGRR